MQIATFLAQYTGLTIDELFNAPDGPLVAPHLGADGTWFFPTWEVPDKDPPGSDAVAVAIAADEPAAPSAVPQVISDRQFFEQLANDGDITEGEALAAVTTGTMPKKLADAIAALPANQQFPAKMLCCGATEFRRSNPMVPVLGQALGKDASALDEIWSAASAL